MDSSFPHSANSEAWRGKNTAAGFLHCVTRRIMSAVHTTEETETKANYTPTKKTKTLFKLKLDTQLGPKKEKTVFIQKYLR